MLPSHPQQRVSGRLASSRPRFQVHHDADSSLILPTFRPASTLSTLHRTGTLFCTLGIQIRRRVFLGALVSPPANAPVVEPVNGQMIVGCRTYIPPKDTLHNLTSGPLTREPTLARSGRELPLSLQCDVGASPHGEQVPIGTVTPAALSPAATACGNPCSCRSLGMRTWMHADSASALPETTTGGQARIQHVHVGRGPESSGHPPSPLRSPIMSPWHTELQQR